MTALDKTNLSIQQKIELGAESVTAVGNYGKVTHLSYKYDISRPTIYSLQDSISTILNDYFELQLNNAEQIFVDKRQLERAIIALRTIAPNSIRSIEELLPILYPGIKVSYGKIQEILSKAESKANIFNQSVNLSAVKNSALDEMFSQGNPVLAGIDLDSGYLHSLELKSSRNSTDWTEVLNLAKSQAMNLEVVVKDAAKGIAAGVTAVFPNAEQRDDCFHVLFETNKLKRKLKSAAYSAIDSEYRAEQALIKINNKQNIENLERESNITNRRIDRFDTFENAARRIKEAMEYVNIKTGRLYKGSDIEKMMIDAGILLKSIKHQACIKLGTYILNRAKGIALAMDALYIKLMNMKSEYSDNNLSLACRIIRLVNSLKKANQPNLLIKKDIYLLFELQRELTEILGEKVKDIIESIGCLLEKRYRASSAIEGFNSFLRPYLYVQKGVTQNFLGLLNAYYNLRKRRWGRHKGTSSFEIISGEKVGDWLTHLGYPPLNYINKKCLF